ncbi:MAG: peptide deformylase [Clostridiales bacterium]|nr:peptide deformylase [Clostridiales bacterium]
MEKTINRDIILLSRKSEEATANDIEIACDLMDTLKANTDRCVGMAANMIGVSKRIIAVNNDGEYLLMMNPEILKRSGKYETEEGCLSLDGVRPTVRYKEIKVRWQTLEMQPKIKTFKGFTAQIIQHELDHLEGIVI